MKFDTIIIGGGLSGLSCGIKLAKEGQRCAIISAGQSALHFFSGSLDLLGYIDGYAVEHPIDALDRLAPSHPYTTIGKERMAQLAAEVVPFFEDMGIKFQGSHTLNHLRITPTGNTRCSWLSCDHFLTMGLKDSIKWKSAALFNIEGFLDFPTEFIAQGLETMGMNCSISAINLPEFERLRKNPTEMRSVNLARVLEKSATLAGVADIINRDSADAEVVILPALFSSCLQGNFDTLCSLISKPVFLLPTMPPSAPGIYIQMQMRKHFQALGGMFMLGDTVKEGIFGDGHLDSVRTVNQGDITLSADNFILASGSFFSHGIVATPTEIYEPVFHLDVTASGDHSQWYDSNFFGEQPYMRFGVAFDSDFHAKKNGKPVENLFVAGSVLGGADSIKEACGGGLSLLTSLQVASIIIKRMKK